MTTPVSERIAYWAGVIGRPLNTFEQLKVARQFRYDVQHQKLYRTLKPVMLGPIYGFVEIDLNFNRPDQTKFDFDLLIHSQSSDYKRDKFLTDVPAPERQTIEGLHGYEVAQWVLYGDVWGQIDLNRLHYLNGRTHGIRRVRLAEVVQPSNIAEQLV